MDGPPGALVPVADVSARVPVGAECLTKVARRVESVVRWSSMKDMRDSMEQSVRGVITEPSATSI